MELDYTFHDPQIRIIRMNCHYCGLPTGPDAECDKIPPSQRSDIGRPEHMSATYYSDSCPFRNHVLFLCQINNVVSEVILKEISTVPGISKISPNSKYEFYIYTNPLFDIPTIKKQVSERYRSKIKELMSYTVPDYSTQKIEAVFPNGKSDFLIGPADIIELQQHIYEEIQDFFPIKISITDETNQT